MATETSEGKVFVPALVKNGESHDRHLQEIIESFETQLDIIRRKPKSLQTIGDSEEFKFGVHMIVWLLLDSVRYTNGRGNGFSRAERKLTVDEGFRRASEQSMISATKDENGENMSSQRDSANKMADILDQVWSLGLVAYLDAAKQARQLDMEILDCVSDIRRVKSRFSTGDWLGLLASVVRNLDQRNELCPQWGKLEDKRMEIIHLGNEVPSEKELMNALNRVSYSYLPEHAAQSCASFKFHCRYLDEELRNLALYVKSRCADEGLHILACQLAANEVELCNLLLRNIDLVRNSYTVFPRNFGLRMYRACLRTGSHYLAEKWMKLRFDEVPDMRELVDTLHGTITSLRKVRQLPTERIKLNGEHEGVGTQTEYKLPEPKNHVNESVSEKPWWVEEFGNRSKGIFRPDPSRLSTIELCNDGSDTVVLSSTEGYDSIIEIGFALDSQKNGCKNRPVLTDDQDPPWIFTHNERLSNYDMNGIDFSIPTLEMENLITIIGSNREGKEQEVKTNIRKDVPYHCRILSYDLLQDEWVITSDFCRVAGPSSEDETSSDWESLIGDCGYYVGVNCHIFKVSKPSCDHRFRGCLKEIRSQCTASYYVDKFANLTKDRYGCLRKLHVDCLLLFANSDRETIIDVMTREPRVEVSDRYKSAIRFDTLNNNTSWKNRGVNTALLEAFVHFSFHESDGGLMVADLQGWVLNDDDTIVHLLSNAVIHSPKYTIRFGETNREEIMVFFNEVHSECNEICRELHLKRPQELKNT